MTQVLSVLWEWRFVIVSILAGVFYLLKDWNKAKSDLYNAMLQAKRKAKDGILKSGQEQEEWVVNFALEKLPTRWVAALGRENTRKLIKWLYQKGMDILDDGKIDNSFSIKS